MFGHDMTADIFNIKNYELFSYFQFPLEFMISLTDTGKTKA